MSMGSAAAVKRDGLDIAAEARGADRIRPQYGRRVAALPFAVGLTDVSLLRRWPKASARSSPSSNDATAEVKAGRLTKQ
jgi:hypothetical protein